MTTADFTTLDAGNIVAFLADIFERRGGEEYLGEPVTMAEHMLQGAHLAQTQGMDDRLIVAALLHDIGHFTSEFGMFTMDDAQDRYHEHAGARLLESFFPKIVVDCVLHHVAAKRYLCATNTHYFAALSAASRHSLKLQGGAMTPQEVQNFEAMENYRDIVALRYLDDAGKDPDLQTPPFEHFSPIVQRVVEAHEAHKKTTRSP